MVRSPPVASRQTVVMNRRNRNILFASCAALLATAIAGTVFAAPAATAATTGSMIRTVDFRNEPWDLDDGVIADVRNGEWETGTDGTGDRRSFQIVDVDHGDIDGDGTEEAIVTTNENTGGTGQFSDAVVFRWTGKGPVRVTSHGIGDRSDGGMYNVVIISGVARIERFTNGEGACCPTEVSTYSVKLRRNKLVTAKPTTTRAYIVLASEGDTPAPIKFLRGGSGAAIEGSMGAVGTFDARKGQRVTITVLTSRYGSKSLPMRLRQGTTLLAQVNGGASRTVVLPASGRFTVDVVGTDPQGFSAADLSIR